MRFTGVRPLLAMAVVVVAGGCSPQGAAEKAIAAADSSLQTVAADAQAYVPDLYTAAGAKIAAAQSDFEAGNFADALTKAQEATTEVGGLGAAISAKKDELAAAWTGMADSLPGMVQAIKARADELSKARRLPAGITKNAVTQAQQTLQEMTANWTQAMDAQSKGDLATAMNLASGVKTKAAEVMTALRMK